MSKPAARVGDMHTCPMVTPGMPPIPHVGGPIIGPGVPNVLIAGMPASVMGDMCTCVGPPDTVVLGSTGVMIGGKPAARMGDQCAHGGVITVGCPTVLIGETGAGGGGGLGAMPTAMLKIAMASMPVVLKAEMAKIVSLKEGAAQGSTYANPAQVKVDPPASTYSVDKAIEALKNNAQPKSGGLCARYVRMALEAGGVEIGPPRPTSAKDYDVELKSKGFSEVPQEEYAPQKGDVVVMENFTGAKEHPHGHIQMYDGEKWVSDFNQKDFWPGSDFTSSEPGFTILRK
jgi:uncharacterized Zn-binding protein involved in type VI secretion